MSILSFEHVSYRYPTGTEDSLREVSLSVAPGEFCVVAGLSGSGKSTLLRAAAGLVPHFHGGSFAGKMIVGGLDTRDHTPSAIGAVAGTLLQDPETQIVMNTVRAELALALENLGGGTGGVARGVEETSLALGIGHLLDRATPPVPPPRFSSASASSARARRSSCSTSRPRSWTLWRGTS
jgi:energy-coupling factor transporter ATP-binding protein EcfA2